MSRRSTINGKVLRTPSLGSYDDRSLRSAGLHHPDHVAPDFKAAMALEREYPSTRNADYALLVALGVNGEVPLDQALRNAEIGRYWGGVPVNDNLEHAVAA